METVVVIENTKMITVKIIGNESENFQRLPYLADNLLLVVIDSKALNPNLFIDYTMCTLDPVGPHLCRSIRTQAY
jgi:hypothetical protein